MLALFAHPDDESLLAGGMLAACAEAGLRVGIVSLTRGELGPISTPGVTREQLGAERERELNAAGEELGAAWSRCLDMPDGELQGIEQDEAVAAIRAVLGPTAPRAVITFAADGLYWHPDHIATRELVHAAVGSLAPIYEATWPTVVVERVVAELRRRSLGDDLWGIDPGAFGAAPETIVAELDVTSLLERKLRALRCHRTQLGSEHLLRVLPDDLARELLGHEWLCAPADHSWLTAAVAAAASENPVPQ